jgi:signal transduction histidine kinase
LASGQLARIEDREPIDVPEMLDRVARENARPGSGVEITVEADDAGTVWGWPAGLRLAVDNLVRNAVTHGAATRVLLTAARQGESLTITVDDNGRGLPADEHEKVLGRFARGSTAAPGGSGLGLALVAQQAALHGGAVELSDGPLGGLRARLTVSTTPEQVGGAGES